MVKGAIYATELYIGADKTGISDYVSGIATTAGPTSYLKFDDNGLNVVSSDGRGFTGFTIKSNGININSNGAFVVNTTNFKLDSSGNLSVTGTISGLSGSSFYYGSVESSDITGGTITGAEIIGGTITADSNLLSPKPSIRRQIQMNSGNNKVFSVSASVSSGKLYNDNGPVTNNSGAGGTKKER